MSTGECPEPDQRGLFTVGHGQDRGGQWRIDRSRRRVDHMNVRSVLVPQRSSLVLTALNGTAGSTVRDHLPRPNPDWA